MTPLQKEQAQNRIDKYLFGQMKKSEEKKFLEDLKTNKELKEMAQFTALLCKALRNRNPGS